MAARKYGFEQSTSDYRTVLEDPEISTVFIATRHHVHARMVVKALQAGKHVFVEKPLALNREELAAIRAALEEVGDRQLMVGFNRRFSPLLKEVRLWLATRSEPLSLIYTVNAGAIRTNHWTQDPEVGGGRIIGEGCHFVDALRFVAGAAITGVEARMIGAVPSVATRDDKMTILLEFADGSMGSVHCLANGSRHFPKERLEAFCEGRISVLDNYQALTGYGWKGLGSRRLWRQDKGHAAEIAAFVDRVTRGGEPLIPWDELEEVSLATFAAVEWATAHARPLDALGQAHRVQPLMHHTDGFDDDTR